MAILGQRISRFANVWKEAGADPALQYLVEHGHKIPFGDDGPPPCTNPSPEYETKLPGPKMDIIRAEVAQLLALPAEASQDTLASHVVEL